MSMSADLQVEPQSGREEAVDSAGVLATAPSVALDPGDDLAEQTLPDIAPPVRNQRVPDRARAWGFVRNLQHGESAKKQPRDIKPAEKDVTLWLDEERYRFLVAADRRVVDDLSPIQFVQFVRQLRHVTSQILFKYEREPNGAAGRALRVWAA
jgi:hypothetical protein